MHQYFKESSGDCDTAEWSEWSPCSHKCSQGNQVNFYIIYSLIIHISNFCSYINWLHIFFFLQRRTRLYIKPFVNGPRSCDVQLIDTQLCWGDEGKEAFSCRETYSLSDYGKCDCYHTDLISSIINVKFNVLDLHFALPQITFF